LKKLIEGRLKENFRTLNARKGAEDVLFDRLFSSDRRPEQARSHSG
jgi:hypothetical protein